MYLNFRNRGSEVLVMHHVSPSPCFIFFHPILLSVQSFASQVPGLKAQRFLAFILHPVKWYQLLSLLFPESPKYKNNTDAVHDDDNDGDCHF